MVSTKDPSTSLTLQSLPYELITEISTYLSYTDTQSFRITSRLFNKVLESIALSRLKLSWTCLGQPSSPGSLIFPLEKIKAYLEPGRSRAFQFVRHLKIGPVCSYLEGRSCNLDRSLGIKPEDLESQGESTLIPRTAVQRRSDFVWYLLRKLILGEALSHLKTIIIDADVMFCASQSVHNPVESIQAVLKLLKERRGSLESCRIEFHHSFHSELSLDDIIPITDYLDIPPCKLLCVRGSEGIEYVRGPLPWIEHVFNTSPGLEGLDIDAPFDEKRIQRFFPAPVPHSTSGVNPDDSESIRTSTNVTQLLRLRLLYTGFTLEQHHFSHLRRLRRLEVHVMAPQNIEPSASSATRRNLVSILWPQFLSQKIFVPAVCIAYDEVENNVLDYLKAYPPRILKSLTIYSRTMYPPVPGCERGLKEMPKRFYVEVLPVIGPWLETLVIDTDVVDDWCLGNLEEAIDGLKGCTGLTNVHVSMDPQSHVAERMDVLRDAFGSLTALCSVTVAEARLGFERLHDIRMVDLM